MASVANINDVLEAHVALEIGRVDRLYLTAYIPNLRVGGQVVRFLRDHLGHQIHRRRSLGAIGNRFRREVKAFADEHEIPLRSRSRIGRGGMTASWIMCARIWKQRSVRDGSG